MGSVDRLIHLLRCPWPHLTNNLLHSHWNPHSSIDTSQNGGPISTAPFSEGPRATTGAKIGLPLQAPQALVNSLPPTINGSSISSTSQHIHSLPPRPESLTPLLITPQDQEPGTAKQTVVQIIREGGNIATRGSHLFFFAELLLSLLNAATCYECPLLFLNINFLAWHILASLFPILSFELPSRRTARNKAYK